MSNCDEIISLLSDYLDRDLPPETCASIEAHLESCPRCEDAADSLRQTVGLCRKYRAADRPGPLPAEKQQELRSAFEKALASVRHDARA
jgi:anti-sigma factor RsiW